MKRIALCFDGTWNTPEDRTNPWRIDRLIAAQDGDGHPQTVYYDEGVGTHWYDWLIGGSFGQGLSKNIRDACHWLARHHEEGDALYLFGFSRGAYTARSLVGLLRKTGLVRAPDDRDALDRLVHEAYDLYRQRDVSPDSPQAVAFRQQHSCAVRVRFIGVWDTVGALGLPFPKIPFSSDYYQFHDTGLSGIVDEACHALAIDEHRKIFAPTLWTQKPEDTLLEQRWFVGAHSDVGGGYKDDRLCGLPLAWLQARAQAAGLVMHRPAGVAPDYLACPVHDSFREFMSGLYRVLRLGREYHRPVGNTLNETIDPSVHERRKADPAYRPPGLEAFLARQGDVP